MSSDTQDFRRALYPAAVYGGLSLGTAAVLMDLWRSHRRYDDAKNKKEKGLMKLYLPGYEGDPDKTASEGGLQKMSAGGISELLVAAALAGGSYYGVNAAYKKIRKRQLEREIEDESKQYIGALQDLGKQAMASTILGIPRDLFLVGLLAGGAGTYGILENTFPSTSEKPAAGTPRKIVVKGFGTMRPDEKPGELLPLQDMVRKYRGLFGAEHPDSPKRVQKKDLADEEKEELERLDKAAYEFEVGTEDIQKAAAFTTLQCAEGEIKENPLAALLGYVIEKKSSDALVKLADDLGILGALEACKGAHEHFFRAAPQQKIAAALSVYADAELAPSFALLTVGELTELSPVIAKQASASWQDGSTGLVGIKIASFLLDHAKSEGGGNDLESPGEVETNSTVNPTLKSEDPIDQWLKKAR